MTLPTTRQRPWIFPTQREFLPTFDLPRTSRPQPTLDLFAETRSEEDERTRQSWQQDARRLALARCDSDHIKDRYRLLNPNPPGKEARLQRIPRHMMEEEDEHELEGGVMTSRAGADYVKQRLAERVREYDVRKTAAFGTEAIPPTPAKAVLGSPSYQQLQDSFTSVIDSIQTGTTENLIPPIKAVLGKLYELGPDLRTEEIAQFARINEDAVYNITTLLGQSLGPGGASKKQTYKNALQNLNRITRLLDKLASPRMVSLSVEDKRLALQRERGSELGLAAEQAAKIPVQTTAIPVANFTPSVPAQGEQPTNVEELRRLYPDQFDGLEEGSEEERTLVRRLMLQPVEVTGQTTGVRGQTGIPQPLQLGRGSSPRPTLPSMMTPEQKKAEEYRKGHKRYLDMKKIIDKMGYDRLSSQNKLDWQSHQKFANPPPTGTGRKRKEKKEKVENRVSDTSKMLDALRKAVQSKKKKS